MADVSQSDIQSLAQKLSAFTSSLTPGEQAALATVVMRGVSQSDDVSGYAVAPNAREHPTDPTNDNDADDFTPVVTVLQPFIRNRRP